MCHFNNFIKSRVQLYDLCLWNSGKTWGLLRAHCTTKNRITVYDLRESTFVHNGKTSWACAILLRSYSRTRNKKQKKRNRASLNWSQDGRLKGKISQRFPHDGYLSPGTTENCTVWSWPYEKHIVKFGSLEVTKLFFPTFWPLFRQAAEGWWKTGRAKCPNRHLLRQCHSTVRLNFD